MRRLSLLSECDSCAGVCCIATQFDASEAFAVDKPAGYPCAHLRADHRCSIHAQRMERGFSGCTGYECYGAGPRVTRAFTGEPRSSRERDAAFLALRAVHESLWLLSQARRLCPDDRPDLRRELDRASEALQSVAEGPPASWTGSDVDELGRSAAVVLRRLGDAIGSRAEAQRRLAGRGEQGTESPAALGCRWQP